MSMDHTSQKLGIEAFPTVRYYTKAGEFEKYHDPAGRHYAGFKHFLETKGFKLGEAAKAVVQTDAKKEEAKKPEEKKVEVKKPEVKKEEPKK